MFLMNDNLIKSFQRPEHLLVTSGPYSFARHPGYLGWAIWAVSTQILLRNPLSFPVFIFAQHSFFSSRIPYEEMILSEFFGEKYDVYRKKTRTWMIGIP
jgi:protein-S-isoprenylcysteine O-methyltransferase